jgi:general secretion pathway protein C
MVALRRYDWTLHLAAIALWTYLLAQAVTTYIGGVLESVPEGVEAKSIRPISSSGADREEAEGDLGIYNVIVERNIFDSAASGAAAAAPEELGPEQLGELGPAVKTSLDIKVLGTLVVGEGADRRSSAVISGGKGGKGAEAYFPGEEPSFSPNVKLRLVAKDRIEFVNGGRLEYAELEDFAAKKTVFASAEEIHGKGVPVSEEKEKKEVTPGTDLEGTKIAIDQKEIDDALQNLDKLMTEIRIVPNFKGGQPAGMKVLSVKPGSVISKLGIKRGDILEKVNGQELDVKQGMELFNQMRDLKNFSLDVNRGGKNQTLEYEIR